jgi:hypothetical protein
MERSAIGVGGQDHAAAGCGVAQAVLEQVVEHLAHAVGVQQHAGARRRRAQFERQSRCLQARFEGLRLGAGELPQVDGFQLDFEGADVGPRQHIQLVDQPVQGKHLAQHGVHGLRACAAHAVLDGLQLGAQHGERSAQLVRGVGHPLTARALRAVESVRERVEVARQLSQFVAARGVEAHVEAALGQHAGAARQLPDRLAEVAREECRRQRRKGHGKGDDEP